MFYIYTTVNILLLLFLLLVICSYRSSLPDIEYQAVGIINPSFRTIGNLAHLDYALPLHSALCTLLLYYYTLLHPHLGYTHTAHCTLHTHPRTHALTPRLHTPYTLHYTLHTLHYTTIHSYTHTSAIHTLHTAHTTHTTHAPTHPHLGYTLPTHSTLHSNAQHIKLQRTTH